MRLMRLGRLLSFMSSRARVLPPALDGAIESLPAAPDSVAALGRVRAALDDDDGVDADEQLAAAAAAAATALERAAHRHGKRGWTTLRDAARPARPPRRRRPAGWAPRSRCGATGGRTRGAARQPRPRARRRRRRSRASTRRSPARGPSSTRCCRTSRT